MQKIILNSAIFLVIIMLNIDITVASVLLTPIAQSLHLQVSQLSWVFTIYLIVFAALIVRGGKLGDCFGYKRVLNVGLVCFVVASLLCGAAQSLAILLLARAVLAVGAALIWPNITTFLYQQYPTEKRGVALGLLTSAIGIGLSLGPIFGGMINTWFGWRWIFLLNVPVTCIAMLIFVVTKCVTAKHYMQRPPLLNTLLLGVSITGFIYAINRLSQPHSLSLVFILLLCSTCVLILYIHLEKKLTVPLLPLHLFGDRAFLQACICRILSVPVIYTTLFVGGLLLQQSWHLSTWQVGLIFLTMTVPIGIASPLAGKLIQKYQPQNVLSIGAVLGIIGAFGFICAAEHHSIHMLLVPLALLGLSFAFASPAALALGLSVAEEKERGAASGVFYMLSMLAGTLVVAIDTLLITRQHSSIIDVQGVRDCFLLLIAANGVTLLLLWLSSHNDKSRISSCR